MLSGPGLAGTFRRLPRRSEVSSRPARQALPGSGKSLAALLRDRRVNYISELLNVTIYPLPVREKDFPVGTMTTVRAWRPIVGLILLVLSCKSPRLVSCLENWAFWSKYMSPCLNEAA